MKKEIKKVEKLVNKKGYIPVTSGKELLFVINKLNGKQYIPRVAMEVL